MPRLIKNKNTLKIYPKLMRRVFKRASDIPISLLGASVAIAVPVLKAAQADDDEVMQLQVSGEGTPTYDHTADIYAPGHEDNYCEFLEDEVVIQGGRVELDPNQLFWTVTASATTPDPLINCMCASNDGSTVSYSFKSGGYLVRNVASNVNQPEAGVVDGDEIKVYLGDFSALTQVSFGGNQLTGNVPDLSNNTALTFANFYNNQLTGSVPDFSNNTALTYASFGANQLTGDVPDFSNNTSLTQAHFGGNQLTGYAGGLTLNFPTINFNFSVNALTESAVNALLIDLDNGTLGAASTINLSGGTSAAPTGLGATAKANLIAAGHTVTTN